MKKERSRPPADGLPYLSVSLKTAVDFCRAFENPSLPAARVFWSRERLIKLIFRPKRPVRAQLPQGRRQPPLRPRPPPLPPIRRRQPRAHALPVSSPAAHWEAARGAAPYPRPSAHARRAGACAVQRGWGVFNTSGEAAGPRWEMSVGQERPEPADDSGRGPFPW